jgi:aminoglycoside 3'-phosphotransferase-2
MLPPAIRALVEGADCLPVAVGKSAASVLRAETSSGTWYLKSGPVDEIDGLTGEADRLRWLAGRIHVPQVVALERVTDNEYLLLTGLPGVNGLDAGREWPQQVAAGMARALRSLHAQPVDDCPFDHSLAVRIEHARQRVRAGLVDESDFDEERIGLSAREVLAELEACRPAVEARTLTHGDACLPNVIFDETGFVGFVDCGRFGVADPYQDLALAARSIGSSLGSKWVSIFFEHYGLSAPDPRKLAFYRLLDEFF